LFVVIQFNYEVAISDLCECISFLQVDVVVGQGGVNTLYWDAL